MAIEYLDVYNLYAQKWTESDLNSESFSHPAKASKGLLAWIFQHAIERGYLVPGQTVILDPFGGVGTTAFYGLQYQCPTILNELESHFVDMSRGCDCTGVSKAEYSKLFSRPKKLAYKGRRLCPQCQSELGRVIEPPKDESPRQIELRQKFQKHRAKLNHYKTKAVKEYYARKGLGKPSRLALKREPVIQSPLPLSYRPQPKQHSLFEIAPPDTLAYERNSGRIPVRPPHHYVGNVERWQKIWPGEVWSLRGDSTKLAEVIREAGIVISSPPFGNVEPTQDDNFRYDGKPLGSTGKHYGASPNQLGMLSIGSPSFTSSAGSDDPDKRGGILSSDPKRKGDKNLTGSYGESEGQMGVMTVGSPPYADQPTKTGKIDESAWTDGRQRAVGKSQKESEGYGTTEGQLGILSVGSPPYGEGEKGHPSLGSVNNDAWGIEGGNIAGRRGKDGNYGQSEGQLSALSIGSPPWAGNSGGQTDAARNGIDPGIFDRHQGGMRGGTGSSEGNLDSLPMVSVGSPPFINQIPQQDKDFAVPHDSMNNLKADYDNSPAQLGNAAPTTFWEASELIINQIDYIFSLHAPNGIMIWITKRFIKDGVVVDFSRQWADLCEYCGFELIEWIRAWQVSEVAVKMTLEGEREPVTKGGVSFFRNLVNQKHKKEGRQEMVIENEDILILRHK